MERRRTGSEEISVSDVFVLVYVCVLMVVRFYKGKRAEHLPGLVS